MASAGLPRTSFSPAMRRLSALGTGPRPDVDMPCHAAAAPVVADGPDVGLGLSDMAFSGALAVPLAWAAFRPFLLFAAKAV